MRIFFFLSMKFSIITLFPESVGSYLGESILKRAITNGHIQVSVSNPRDFATDKHHKADDRPYGGGPGMVMYALPVVTAIKAALPKRKGKRKAKVIIFSPGGKQFTNAYARDLVKKHDDVVLVSGRYEGIDSRVKKILKTDPWFRECVVTEEVSIGDYVLSGGELASLVVIEATARQIPGVLGDQESIEENRVSSHELYTRPEKLSYNKKTYPVPKVLLSGDHKKIEEWKKGRKQ